ncbi:motility protein A [mine drainage metagenome]|uniref:Motility protein A n=1 Tax=mine drainage metagenome TaxID=410659 RepID=A0A1J5RZG9_9ZZZZ
MLVIIGYVVVASAVFGSFILGGGHIAALFQPFELMAIAGASLGAFFVANTPKVVKATLRSLPTVLKGSRYTKAMYIDLLAMLYEILSKVRKEGLMSIEADIEKPDASAIFSKYPTIVSDHHALEFLTDYLRMMVGGNLNAFEIENLMDNEIETHHHEGEVPIHALAKTADALPAFGIVSAVMGVVHTMESVGLPPAELGKLIAAALVGTFLGILLSYGFVGPLSSTLEHKLNESSKIFQCMKVTLLASMNGYAPQVAIEFGRKVLYSTERPGFLELEEEVKNRKAK